MQKSLNLQVRINEEEKRLFEHRAKSSGLSLSSWVRDRLLQASHEENSFSHRDQLLSHISFAVHNALESFDFKDLIKQIYDGPAAYIQWSTNPPHPAEKENFFIAYVPDIEKVVVVYWDDGENFLDTDTPEDDAEVRGWYALLPNGIIKVSPSHWHSLPAFSPLRA